MDVATERRYYETMKCVGAVVGYSVPHMTNKRQRMAPVDQTAP